MTALKAHIKNGRIVVDEPVDLPEGAEVSVYLYDAAADNLSPQERAALGRALERGLAQADAGDLIDADVVLAELEVGKRTDLIVLAHNPLTRSRTSKRSTA